MSKAEEFLTKERTARALREAEDSYHAKVKGGGPGPRTYTEVDKCGFGFNLDRRFAAFTVEVSLDSWTGQWGSSSCSTFLHVADREAAKAALIEYLNRHAWEIMEGMADIIDSSNGEAKVAYREELQAELERLNV